MKLIPVGKYFAKIDDEDYELVSSYKWRPYKGGKPGKNPTIYAMAHSSTKAADRKSVIMHRIIMRAEKGVQVDHKDRDGINNQKDNLRFANNSQNASNKKALKGRKYKGVSFRKRNKINKFEAQTQSYGKFIYIGSFETEVEAAKAYDEKALELHGEFAFLNFPNEERNGIAI